jgi:GntR family transcriptional regulator
VIIETTFVKHTPFGAWLEKVEEASYTVDELVMTSLQVCTRTNKVQTSLLVEVIMSSDPLQNEQVPIRKSHVPKYYWLQEILRNQIGGWEVGHPLPSETELCRLYSVSRTTVRKAIDGLTQEGLVQRLQGKGTYVAHSKMKVRFIQRRMGFFEDMVARGFQVQSRTLQKGIITPKEQVAAVLELEAQEKVLRIVRLRFIHNEPILLAETFLPYRLFPDLLHENLEDVSLYGLLAARYGVQIKSGTSWVDAGLANQEEAEKLNIPTGSALLIVSECMRDAQGRAIEYGIAKQRADRTQIELSVLPT